MIFTTVTTFMSCKSPQVCCSADLFNDTHLYDTRRSDVVLAAICPEWKCLLNV